MDGGGNFRANFGVEKDGKSLLAADGSFSKGADIKTGYPEVDHVMLKKLAGFHLLYWLILVQQRASLFAP